MQGGAGPRLDATAKAAYRARLEALRAEIDEAVALGDGARAERAREELEFVTRELDLAVGLGGRDRTESGSHAERARVNVTRAIRSTVKRIAGYDARLGPRARERHQAPARSASTSPTRAVRGAGRSRAPGGR